MYKGANLYHKKVTNRIFPFSAEYFIEVTSPSCDPLGLEVISGDERFSER